MPRKCWGLMEKFIPTKRRKELYICQEPPCSFSHKEYVGNLIKEIIHIDLVVVILCDYSFEVIEWKQAGMDQEYN